MANPDTMPSPGPGKFHLYSPDVNDVSGLCYFCGQNESAHIPA